MPFHLQVDPNHSPWKCTGIDYISVFWIQQCFGFQQFDSTVDWNHLCKDPGGKDLVEGEVLEPLPSKCENIILFRDPGGKDLVGGDVLEPLPPKCKNVFVYMFDFCT